MEPYRTEENADIEEMEVATKQLKSAYSAVLNTFARIAKNPTIKTNPTQAALDDVDIARTRFEAAKLNMDSIVEEIRNGTRQ